MPHTLDTSTSVISTDSPNANDPSAPTSEETRVSLPRLEHEHF